jgi:prevent-host-death family protein
METVGVRELKQKTTQVLRRVREKKAQIQVTYRGEVVALLVPVPSQKRKGPTAAEEAAWADLDQLAAEIGANWPKGVTAVDAIREDRR